MSFDTFLGFFDADGSVLIKLYSQENVAVKVGVYIVYYIGQSLSKADTVIKVAEIFNATVTQDANNCKISINSNKPAGEKVRECLLAKKPLHPGRRRDFLISEVILGLIKQKAHKTNVGLVTIIELAYSKSINIAEKKSKRENSQRHDKKYWLSLVNPTEEELEVGLANAAGALVSIEKEVALLEKQLPTMKLSLDYIRGAHFGDGGFTVALTWKPNAADRRRAVPEWTISGENKSYCKAFVNSMGGDINLSGKNCYKFRISGIAACRNILWVFEQADWMPSYKKEQFERFKKAVWLLVENKHMTEAGVVELVNLVYDMSEKGSRRYSKEQYIEWGIQWLRGRQGRLL